MSAILDKLSKDFKGFIDKALLDVIVGKSIFITIDNKVIELEIKNIKEIKK